MATLTGKKINTTYDGLLKTEDNQPISTTKKKVTDGYGNETGLSVDSLGNVDVSDDLNVLGNASVSGSTTANSFIKTGGTSSQFLKADGSLDSNTYITSSTDTLDSVTDRGNSTTNSITVNGLTATSATVDSLEIQFGLRDQTNSLGTSGQILTSTGTATDWKSTSELGLIDGSGTANYIAKFTDGDTIGNSLIYDDGTNVGVSGGLSVSNTISILSLIGSNTGASLINFGDSDDVNVGRIYYDHPSNFMQFKTGDAERMRIHSTGDVSFRDTSNNEAFYWDASTARLGIGTTSPAAKLDVEGLMLNGSTNPSIMDGGNLRKKLEWNGALNSFGVYNTTNAGADWQTNLLIDSSGITTFKNNVLLDNDVNRLTLDSISGANRIMSTTTGFGAYEDLQFRADNYIFSTGTTERMRIDSAGNVGINTSNPTALQEIFLTTAGKALRLNTNFANGNSVDLNPYVTGINNGGFEIRINDAPKLVIWTNDDLHVDGDVIAYSTTISDQRLKDDIQTIDNALDKVSNLRGVSYTWNNGNRKGQKDLGLIAQEVEQVLPELVREKEMPMIDGGTYKTVDYEKIVGVLIEAVKELTDKVNKLEAK